MDWSIKELLDRLQTCDECCRIEAKECKTALGKSARETISAFANEPGLGGGYLVIGLKKLEGKDPEGYYSLVGVDDPDRLQCEIAGACRDEFNVQVSSEIWVGVVEDKPLVVVFIPEAFPRDKPVFIKRLGIEKGAFRRIGSSDRRYTAHDLDQLYQFRRGVPYESEVLPDVSWEDIDPDVITSYRRRRSQINSEAAELELDDQELLVSLRCLVRRNGTFIPNVSGLLLFGTKTALRRIMPTDARVDYVITEGPEWIGDPSVRHYATDYREPLINLLPRLHAQIMGDLPKLFTLETGQLQRTDKPSIPRDVIREALANALMHRDYCAGQPTLVIRYSNRLEFKNAGYSLKPFEELGQPGSKQRNPIISAVFHELKYAEGKGTGIGSMKEWMREAGLNTPPIIETDRDRNEFDLVLLPHHLLDQKDLEWLAQFKDFKLSDAERRALVLAREMRAITNQDYRQINGTDTLSASRALSRLRDMGLLTMKGTGNGTYYVLSEQAFAVLSEGSISHTTSLHKGLTPYINPLHKGLTPYINPLHKGLTPYINPLHKGLTPYINPLHKGLTPYINPLHKGLDAIPKGDPDLPQDLRQEVASLPKRCSKKKMKEIIKRLCSLRSLQPNQLGQILDRDAQYLRINFLSKMIKTGELILLYPDQPAHPQQAYKTPSDQK